MLCNSGHFGFVLYFVHCGCTLYVVFQALLLDPHHKKARYRLAQALQGQGKLAKAFEEVTGLQQRNPEVNYFNYLGYLSAHGQNLIWNRMTLWPYSGNRNAFQMTPEVLYQTNKFSRT